MTLSIDIETFSPEDLTRSGVYRYAEAPDFRVLLFGYSCDGGPVTVVDLASGESLPPAILSALGFHEQLLISFISGMHFYFALM